MKRRVWKLCLIGTGALAVLLPRPAAADYTATATQAWDCQWKGWGCSLAWWANAVTLTSYGDTYAGIVFGSGGTVTYNNQSVTLPGLELNVMRYNVGGGGPGNTLYNGTPWYKDIQGYWPGAWSSWDPTTSGWNWYADSAQRNMMWKARDRGANILQFFSDSPMWWMTNSQSTNGAQTRGENLNSTYYNWFCNYLAQVVKYANANWGVSIDSVEAFNEPSAYWWDIADGNSQEGCTFTAGSQASLLPTLRSALNGAGQSGVRIAASDENDPGTATSTWNTFGTAGVQGDVGLVTTHSYSGQQPYRDNTGRQKLRTAIGSRELWVTEYGDNDGSGQALCTTITEDVNYERPTVWCYWQPVEASTAWGFLNADYSTGATTWVYTKHYVFANFTNYIRPGMYIFKSSDTNTIFAYDNSAGKLVILTVNYGTAQNVTYDLSALSSIGSSYDMIQTKFDGSALLAHYGPWNLSSSQIAQRKFTAWYPANCVSVLRINATQ
ncbi:MAG TPA: glycoside hydrolase [Chthonomonadaceae bacterium]|nr:glycoside hydrolase [Chthonomonadaceae bacterium]